MQFTCEKCFGISQIFILKSKKQKAWAFWPRIHIRIITYVSFDSCLELKFIISFGDLGIFLIKICAISCDTNCAGFVNWDNSCSQCSHRIGNYVVTQNVFGFGIICEFEHDEEVKLSCPCDSLVQLISYFPVLYENETESIITQCKHNKNKIQILCLAAMSGRVGVICYTPNKRINLIKT